MNYVKLSTKFFGKHAKKYKYNFLDVLDDIHKSNMNYTLEEYLSMTFMTTAVTFVAEMCILTFIFALFIDPVLALPLAFTLTFALSVLVFFLFYSYPATLAKNRRNKIKKVLPFTVSYLSTLASSKLPPITMFKTMSKFKEYGELSKEAENIVRNVEMFGMSFSSSLKKQAKRTPSPEFADLLWGINIVTTTGGDLVTYLNQKTNEFMNDYRRNIRKYSQDLSLYTEIYLTLVITGSIFFIVLSSVITALSTGTGTVSLQTFIVFLLLPLLSGAFLVLIKSVSPME